MLKYLVPCVWKLREKRKQGKRILFDNRAAKEDPFSSPADHLPRCEFFMHTDRKAEKDETKKYLEQLFFCYRSLVIERNINVNRTIA